MFSPNSQWIAYVISQFDGSQSIVHVSKIDGSEKRKLYERKAQEEWLDMLGWAPDGTQVIVDESSKTDRHLVFALDATTGAKKDIAQVATVEGRDSWSLSSDGRYVARRIGSYPRRITLLDLKSGHEEIVVDRDAEDVVGWTSGNSKLVYSKNRPGAKDIWAIAVKDGKLLGAPELVWSNWGDVSPIGITRDGVVRPFVFGIGELSVRLCLDRFHFFYRFSFAVSGEINRWPNFSAN